MIGEALRAAAAYRFRWQALLSNTSYGRWNTASGVEALLSNSEGSFNTASGFGALWINTNGSNNTAIGASALYNGSYRVEQRQWHGSVKPPHARPW